MLHTQYQVSRPCGFRQEDTLSLYKPMQNVNPGAGPFLVQGYNLNKLGRGPLDDAIQNIKALNLVVSDKIFSCFPYISLCKK